MCNFPSGNFPKFRLGPLEAPHTAKGGRVLQLRWARGLSAAVRTGLGQELRLEQTWEVLAWEIADLGCCPCGKYPWEVATWEKSFWKAPNTIRSERYFAGLGGIQLSVKPFSESCLIKDEDI